MLGPVEVSIAGRVVPLGGQKPKALFAALLVDSGKNLSVARLIEAIWGEQPPETARAVVQTYVSTLRQTFARVGAPALIVRQPPGYLLQTNGARVDRDAFEALFAEGRQALADHRYHEAVDLLRDATRLWRGGALEGLDSELLSSAATRLDEMRLVAVEERVGAEIQLGRLDSACLELTELVHRHPYRERFRAQLMVALNGLGRRSDALAVYRQGRRLLVEEMGIEPNAHLRAVHEMVLRDDGRNRPVDLARPVTPGRRPVAWPGSADSIRPALLPPVAADFTGRADERSALVVALGPVTTGAAAQVQAIVGPPGVGKSVLAVRVAHDIARDYPDGQLYADLGGAVGKPADPGDILGRFLSILGWATSLTPDTVEARMERYRTLLDGRRMLIVLDDADSSHQIQALLPGSDSCAVVVTSRRRLGGLPGARFTELGAIGPGDARALLRRIVGSDRVEAEQGAAERILHYCAGLPLAVRVAGTRLVHRQGWPLEIMADRLANEARRLDELSVDGDSVRGRLDSNCRALGPEARRVLLALGALRLTDFPSWVVQATLPSSAVAAEQAVEELADAQVVGFTRVDPRGQLWYRMNEFFRLYARGWAEREIRLSGRRDIVCRVMRAWPRDTAVPRPVGESSGTGCAVHQADDEELDRIIRTVRMVLSALAHGGLPTPLARTVPRAARRLSIML